MVKWKYGLIGLVLSFGFLACDSATFVPEPVLEIRGADLSFATEISSTGTVYFDSSGVAKDVLTIFKEAGCNTVRLRLWHTPANSHSGLAELEVFSTRLKDAGFKIWLDIHYSDTWADPGHQLKPAAWNGLPFTVLTDSVAAYTTKVLQHIHPDYLQVGNEINHGFIWEEGRMSNQEQFLTLLKAGISAARATTPATKIIIHYAGVDEADAFYQLLEANTVDYDIIGISYYPMWHGKDLAGVELKLLSLMDKYDKPLVLAEIAYPFTLEWNDYTNNIVGDPTQIIDQFPATPNGQAGFLEEIRQMAAYNQSKGFLGFCYWAPDWVAYRGPTATDGSAWENQALFDFNNKALPGMKVFRE